MVDVEEATYKEIVAKLEDAALADKLATSEEWKLVHRAIKDLRDKAQQDYNNLDHTDSSAKLKAMQCQVAIQFYDDFFKTLLQRYKVLGEEAYEYAKDMGIVSNLALWIKTKF